MSRHAYPRLDELSPRTLNLLAQIFARGPARVVPSRRATYPVTLALESNTVVLHPDRAGLYDLVLGCAMLAKRAWRKRAPKNDEARDEWLTRRARAIHAPEARAALEASVPGVRGVPGVLGHTSDFAELRVVHRAVEWEPLPPLAPPAPGRSGGRVEMQHLPEIEVVGGGDDFAWVTDGLASGALATEKLPGFPEVPFLRVPFRQNTGDHAPPTLESWEALIERHAGDVAGLMQCFRRKAEVREERRAGGPRTRDGVHLDSGRLVDAVIARRTGVEPRLFRARRSYLEPVFDPAEFLVVCLFDLNDLTGPT